MDCAAAQRPALRCHCSSGRVARRGPGTACAIKGPHTWLALPRHVVSEGTLPGRALCLTLP
eukprot:6120379-Prymnesium_polylepis.1